MLAVHVFVHVKREFVEAFQEATMANAVSSQLEAGVARFDVLQQADDPVRFVLIEVYRDEGAPAAHKVTAHYQTWREAVEPMMAEPRRSQRYTCIFPDPGGW